MSNVNEHIENVQIIPNIGTISTRLPRIINSDKRNTIRQSTGI